VDSRQTACDDNTRTILSLYLYLPKNRWIKSVNGIEDGQNRKAAEAALITALNIYTVLHVALQ